MKRVLALLICVLTVFLVGCSASEDIPKYLDSEPQYTVDDVNNVLSELTRPNFPPKELSRSVIEWYEADSAVYAASLSSTYYDTTAFLFPSSEDAWRFLEHYKNDQISCIHVKESGEDFCYMRDSSYCESYGERYIYRRSNVAFMATKEYSSGYFTNQVEAALAESTVSANERSRENYLNYCRNYLPELADRLD